MLVVQDPEYFAEVVAFAKRHNLVPDLCRNLEWWGKYANGEGCTYDRALGRDTRVLLFKDHCRAPMSFEFVVQRKREGEDFTPWFAGGLMYQGPLDDGDAVLLNGSAPSFTVSLSNKAGWSSHT